MKKTVCLIGRPNVGKSTIFNKLIKENKSIIMDTPGVTRDRIYGTVNYDDYSFLLIDTGGIDYGKEDFNKDIRLQAEIAIEESDVILFIVDGREDLTSNDLAIRDMLMKTDKKVIVVLNKLDNPKMQEERIYYYYELGFEYDEYSSTMTEHHQRYVQEQFLKMIENGYIFEKEEILVTKIEEKDETTDEPGEEEGEGGLEGWAIALIAVGSVIALIIIALVIWKCVLSKGHVDSEIIGSLVEKSNANEMGESKE